MEGARDDPAQLSLEHLMIFALSFLSAHAAATSAPTAAVVTIDGALVREDAVAAGQVASDAVTLQNDGDTPFRAMIYLSDVEGEANSNRPWVRFTPRLVVVPAGMSTVVPYRVEVPEDAPQGGVYESVLVVTSAPEPPEWPPARDAYAAREDVNYTVRLVTYVEPTTP